MSKQRFYLTTPLYYVNGQPHIGHAYTTIVADTLARYHRLKGEDVFLLTGTDEHGQKIEREAQNRGQTTSQMVDELAAEFKAAWQKMGISYDRFIRTTEKEHVDSVLKFIQKIYDNGYIYQGEYTGWYCTPCETYWTEEQLTKGNLCPDCGRPTEKLSEKSYFFKLSAFAAPLLAHIEKNPAFVRPETRLNEIVSFLKMGLKDLSISRANFRWGIPLPFDDKYIIYVWFDALVNYIAGVDYLCEGEPFKKYWPADLHLVGKDIIKFHAVIWPAMLLAASLPPPRQIFAHGWWLNKGDKMSKSKGNVIDPLQLIDKYGLDGIRYFLLREVPFGLDGTFSEEALVSRMNTDLANDLGNLLHRSTAMLQKYFNCQLRPVINDNPADQEFKQRIITLADRVEPRMQELQFSLALTEIWDVIKSGNKYIDTMAPWGLFKAGQTERLQEVMYNIFELLRVVTVLLTPFIPGTAAKIWERINPGPPLAAQTLADTRVWGGIKNELVVGLGEPLFPRIEA